MNNSNNPNHGVTDPCTQWQNVTDSRMLWAIQWSSGCPRIGGDNGSQPSTHSEAESRDKIGYHATLG